MLLMVVCVSGGEKMYREKIQIYLRSNQKKEYQNLCKKNGYNMSDRLREHITIDLKEWMENESNQNQN